MVAIFTIIARNQPNDWGYSEAQRFIEAAREPLEEVTVANNLASESILRDTTLTGKVMNGGRLRDVRIDTLVVESVDDAGPDFDARYDALSERADLILFNGHARLGANTNALGRKGTVIAGKYQLVLVNACDSFALIDTAMTERRRERNGPTIDPAGTRFLDVISNARPGYAHHLASVSNEVYTGRDRLGLPDELWRHRRRNAAEPGRGRLRRGGQHIHARSLVADRLEQQDFAGVRSRSTD